MRGQQTSIFQLYSFDEISWIAGNMRPIHPHQGRGTHSITLIRSYYNRVTVAGSFIKPILVFLNLSKLYYYGLNESFACTP